jgi:aminomethyltransferase
MPLYGHELSLSVNPFEAGLGRFVSFKKSFTGRDALERYAAEEPARMLRGIVSSGKAVPRQGCLVFSGEERAGEVTSGTYSPSLDKSIAMVYIKRKFSAPGTRLEAEIRSRRIGAAAVELPFYKKERKHGTA